MVELVSVYDLETMLRAINDNKFHTSANVSKLRELKLCVYETDMPPLELVYHYDLAKMEYARVASRPIPTEYMRPRLRLVAG